MPACVPCRAHDGQGVTVSLRAGPLVARTIAGRGMPRPAPHVPPPARAFSCFYVSPKYPAFCGAPNQTRRAWTNLSCAYRRDLRVKGEAVRRLLASALAAVEAASKKG